jgi:hypothetical protein
MSYRQGPSRQPGHGGGRFDDPFMIPEPPPRGERPQRRAAVVALVLLAIGIAAFFIRLIIG